MSILNSIPPIRYLNLDKNEDRRFYIENQFKKHGITDFKRISADRFGVYKFDEWNFDGELLIEKQRISCLLNQLQSVIDWYNEETSETCLIVEDDLNLDLCKYWGFDWEYFQSHLPCNWDCVQLQVVGEKYVPMGLSVRNRTLHGSACYMVNRHYAEKVIKLFYNDGVFRLPTNYGYYYAGPLRYHYQSSDWVPYNVGVTYSFPLFITNTSFVSELLIGEINKMVIKSDKLVANWWVNKSKDYSLDELFCAQNPDRMKLIVPIPQ